MAEATTSDSAPLSVDDAASLLRSPAAEAEAPEVDEADEPEIEPDAEDQPDEPDEGDETPEEEPDEPVAEEPAKPAIEPPASWDADARARFAQLPPELQEYTLGREQQRDQAVNSALERAATARKSAETEAAQNQQYRAAVAEILPQAAETFRGKWDGIDWAAWAQEDPTACYQAEQQFKADQLQLQQLQAAQQIGEQNAYREFLQAEQVKLPQVAPDLVDPEKGPELRRQLTEFLGGMGVTDADLKFVKAEHLAIALDAMKFRQLKAQAESSFAARPAPTPPAASPRPVRPSTTPQQGSSRIRERDKSLNRLSQTQTVDDAVAALRASRKASG